MQHDGTHADQAPRLDRARFEMNHVAEDAIVTDHGWPFDSRVQHGVVLHTRALTNPDFTVVTTQHRTRPHRTVRTDGDRADNNGVWMHIRVRMDGRNLIAERIDGHSFQP